MPLVREEEEAGPFVPRSAGEELIKFACAGDIVCWPPKIGEGGEFERFPEEFPPVRPVRPVNLPMDPKYPEARFKVPNAPLPLDPEACSIRGEPGPPPERE